MECEGETSQAKRTQSIKRVDAGAGLDVQERARTSVLLEQTSTNNRSLIPRSPQNSLFLTAVGCATITQ